MDRLPHDGDWYFEEVKPTLYLAERVRRILYSGQTPYQRVEVIETEPYGRALVLDGRTQSSEADEWVYHEALVQPSLMAHAAPQRVFIAGGGEGATAREALRCRSVNDVVMVDLDRAVVELCREHLPLHHQGAFDDPRLTLLYEDALAYLETHSEPFDLIIVDVPDPLESGPAYLLFTQEFYRLVRSRLRVGGLMVAQAGPAGPTNVSETFTAIRHTASSIFERVSAYSIYMPSFGTSWGFVVGGDGVPDVASMRPAEVDARIAMRLAGELRYYDGEAHLGMFHLPKYARQAFEQETRLITRAQPLYAV